MEAQTETESIAARPAPTKESDFKESLPVESDWNFAVIAQRQGALLELLRQERLWLQTHRIYYFSPICNKCYPSKVCQNPTEHHNRDASPQWAFLHTPVHVKLIVGTNRSGKSDCGIADDAADALGFRPWELPDELKKRGTPFILKNPHLIPESARTRIKTPARILLIAEDWEKANEIFIEGTPERAGLLTKYIPGDALRHAPEKDGQGNICQFTFLNGSIIKIDTEKSFINNRKSFEGAAYDKVHYDEPKMRPLRDALARGLADTDGYESFTLTPLAEPWIKNEIYDKAGIDPEIEHFFLDARFNPHISAEGWKRFGEKLSELEYAARVKGEWTFARGLVYKEFSALPREKGGNLCNPIDKSVSESLIWMQKNTTLYIAIDPHPKLPMTAMFMLVDAKGIMTVWDEIHAEVLIPEFCDMILSKIPAKMEPAEIIIDPLAFEADPRDGLDWASDFISNGIAVTKAPKRRAAGILATQQALKDRRLLVCSNCTHTIHELQTYMYRRPTQQYEIDLEKPVDKDDHFVECLYRLVLIEPTFVEPGFKSRPIREPEES